MTGCNQCGGPFTVVPSGLTLEERSPFNGLMLACADCGRPLKLLFHSDVPKPRRRTITKQDQTRALRAARRKSLGRA